MAITKNPLFAHQASGTIGELLTFSNWKGRSYTRTRGTQTPTKNYNQSIARAVLAWVSQSWTEFFTQADRDAWIDLANATKIAPKNAAIAFNIQAVNNQTTWQVTPNEPPALTDPTYTIAPTPIIGTHQIGWGWTLSALNDGWGQIFVRLALPNVGPGFTELPKIAILDPGGPQSWTDTKLSSGTYSYTLVTVTRSGQFANFANWPGLIIP